MRRRISDDELTAGIDRLTGRLSRVLATTADANVAFSGLGVWGALAVLGVAADGETANELEGVLGVERGRLAGSLARLDERIGALAGAAHAQAVWARVPVHRAFRESLPGVAFGALDGRASLDRWCAEKTFGLIDRFPLDITGATMLALADAVALHARWADVFPTFLTDDRPFTVGGGPTVAVPTMQRRASASTVSDATGVRCFDQWCEPADGKAGALLRIGLPPEGMDPATAIAALTERNRRPVAADLVDVFLPRFHLRNTLDLTATLAELGAARALTDAAEFPHLSPEPLAVDQVVQDALVEVDEEGVKAAAVTAVAMRAGSMVPTNPPVVIELHFDRSFAFALLEPDTSMPLFVGWVADPRR